MADVPLSEGAPYDEVERLRDLFALDLIDGRPSDRFDRFTRIASHTFNVAMAQVTLLDDSTQWFCATVGPDPVARDRVNSFCTHLVDTDTDVLVVEDTTLDERFADLDVVVGEPFVRFYAGASVRSPSGQRIGTICVLDLVPRSFGSAERAVLRDIADLVETEIRHVALSMTDELTGLANLRAFRATLDRFMRLGERRNEPVTVLFADVDGLKTINDLEGHSAGDQLLRHAGAALLRSVRSSDMVARIGGDEFAIVAYGLADDETARCMTGIKDAVASSNQEQQPSFALSISVGAATGRPGESIDELIGRADQAMYEAKRRRSATVETN